MALDPERMLKAAIAYARRGWYVFPLSTTGDRKKPHGMLGRAEDGKPSGQAKATLDIDQIRTWWTRDPNAGIAVFLKPSNLIAVDIDPRNGGDMTMQRLEGTHGKLEPALVSRTGGGGFHYVYEAPEGLKAPPGRLGPKGGGIELKWDGYIVLPPSRWNRLNDETKLYEGDTRYKWASGHDPRNAPTPLPAWCLAASEGGSRPPGEPGSDDDALGDFSSRKADLRGKTIEWYLQGIPNTRPPFEYNEWFEVLCAVYHQTDGSAEGREAVHAWSLTSDAGKHNEERFNKSWNSAQAKLDKTPVTFRTVLWRYYDNRREIAAELARELKAKLSDDLLTQSELQALIPKIKKAELQALDRRLLEQIYAEKIKLLTGLKTVTAKEARLALRYEDPTKIAMPKWLEGVVYLSEPDMFLRVDTGEMMKASAFDHRYNRLMLSPMQIREGDTTPETPASEAALHRYDIPKHHNWMYAPDMPETFVWRGRPYVNTYSNKNVPAVPDRLSNAEREAQALVEKHFEILCPHADERALVVSWFASIVQTGVRPNWCPVIQGAQGIGKSLLMELMSAVLGPENVRTTFATTVVDGAPFNSWAAGAQITFIDEVKRANEKRVEIMERVQQVITNDTIELHEKKQIPRPVRNTSGLVMLTNHRDALAIDDSDSRYYPIASAYQTSAQVAGLKKKYPTHFADLLAAMDDHPGALRKFFLDYKLAPEFSAKARALPNRERAHIIAVNEHPNLTRLREILAVATAGHLSNRCMSVERATQAFADENPEVLPPPDGRVIAYMIRHSLGFSHIGRFKVDGKMQTFYSLLPETFSDDEGERAAQVRALNTPGL